MHSSDPSLPERGKARESRPAKAVQHARILLACQDVAAGNAARACLSVAGYSVDLARDEASALSAARTMPPDMVVLISPVPDAQGNDACFALAHSLKDATEGGYLPVLTAASSLNDETWEERGADDILPLPLAPSLLLRRVGSLLHLRRLYQAVVDSAQETAETCTEAQQAAARYQEMFALAPIPLLLVSPGAGRILNANLCALALTEYTPEQMVGLPLASLEPPEGEGLWATQTASAGVGGNDAVRRDAVLLTARGVRVPVEVRSMLAQGTQSALIVALHDRRDEQARLGAAGNVAAAEMAKAFSQEINNPLFVISSNAELLQAALLEHDSSLQIKVGRIADASHRIAAATGRLAAPSSK